MRILWIFLLFVQVMGTPCWNKRNEMGHHLLGAYVPQCTETGFYHPKQCHGSTGYCWCVFENGIKRVAAVPPGMPLEC